MQEVGGAVQGVDDPAVGLVGALDQAALLAQEAVAGAGLGQFLEQGLLSLDVGGGDEVGGALLGDLKFAHLAEIARQAPRGLAGRVDHHLEQGGGRGHENNNRGKQQLWRGAAIEGRKGPRNLAAAESQGKARTLWRKKRPL